MIKKWRRCIWLVGIAVALGLGAVTMAQSTTSQRFKGPTGSTMLSEQTSADLNRLMEIQVELAWLSDRTTFNYYLEAHVKGTALEVRGYVPSKTVREQAINLAKLNCSLSVTDAIKAHPSLVIRTTHRVPDQLTDSVQTALHEAFPNQQLTVNCQDDGTVQVFGSVRSFEQKLAVSRSLRRLHGCTSVANFTEVGGGEIARHFPKYTNNAFSAPSTTPKVITPVVKAPPVKAPPPPTATYSSAMIKPVRATTDDFGGQSTKAPSDRKRDEPFTLIVRTPPAVRQTETITLPAASAPSIKITTVEGPVLPRSDNTGLLKTPDQVKPGDAYESRGVVVVSTEEPASPQPTSTWLPPLTPAQPQPAPPAKASSAARLMNAPQLKKRIESAVPGVHHVNVTFTSKTDVHVECAIRPGEDTGAVARQILALREFDPYKVDLEIQQPTPNQR
jgi:hypothetical protein